MTSDDPHTARDTDEAHLDALGARVRKVQRLDPFDLVVCPDGRFRAELTRAVDELDPDDARTIVRELEPVIGRLRRRAERS